METFPAHAHPAGTGIGFGMVGLKYNLTSTPALIGVDMGPYFCDGWHLLPPFVIGVPLGVQIIPVHAPERGFEGDEFGGRDFHFILSSSIIFAHALGH